MFLVVFYKDKLLNQLTYNETWTYLTKSTKFKHFFLSYIYIVDTLQGKTKRLWCLVFRQWLFLSPCAALSILEFH